MRHTALALAKHDVEVEQKQQAAEKAVWESEKKLRAARLSGIEYSPLIGVEPEALMLSTAWRSEELTDEERDTS